MIDAKSQRFNRIGLQPIQEIRKTIGFSRKHQLGAIYPVSVPPSSRNVPSAPYSGTASREICSILTLLSRLKVQGTVISNKLSNAYPELRLLPKAKTTSMTIVVK